MRILHVEDTPQIVRLINRVLSTPSREIIAATTFKEFQQLLNRGESDFDFVISDAHIPMFAGESARYMAHEILGESQRFLDTDIPFMFLTSEPAALGDLSEEVPCFDKLGNWMDGISELLIQRESELKV